MAFKIDYLARETGNNLRRNLSLTVASVLTIAVSLSLVGASLLFRSAVSNATQQWENGIEFIVYLQPDATEDQRDAVERQLVDSPQVEDFIYFDQDRSFEEFKELFKNTPQLVDAVTPDILPPSYRVVPVDKSPETVETLTSQFNGQPGVRETVAAFESIRTIRDISRIFGNVLLAVAVALLLAAALLILNSIRMAIFARRREIEIMKLVGASNWFIRIPFMLEGVIQGVAGSIVSIGVIVGLRRAIEGIAADPRFTLISGLTVDSSQLTGTATLVVVTGVVIGALGSAFAVSRFLDV